MSTFATLADLWNLVGYTGDATRGQWLLDQAEALVKVHLGQQLVLVSNDVITYRPITDLTGATVPIQTLILPERPVRAVDSVVVDGTTLTQGTDYVADRWGILRHIGSGWTWATAVVVTYDHGYTTVDPEFSALRAVVTMIAGRALTINKAPEFDQFGAPSDASGFAPELFLSGSEVKDLADLAAVGIG